MRVSVCSALVAHASDPELVFLTGDLGYNALEPLRDALGPRFINAGVAEQNMVSVAAGLTSSGLRPWVYSISSFLYGRAFEQIRNDVCLHDLPVRLVGNGGGYSYGAMGATHHALEDYGTLLGLPNMRAFVPAFAGDVAPVVGKLMALAHPAYLRLGRCELPAGFAHAPYQPWRRLLDGGGPTALVVGPLAGSLLAGLAALAPDRRPATWVLAELPPVPGSLPAAFLDDLRRSGSLAVVEEHAAHGGAGAQLCELLALMGRTPPRYRHLGAAGYPSGRYGSQAFHRAESGLDAASVIAELLVP